MNDPATEHRGQPRRLEWWAGGAWIIGIVALISGGVLFFASEGGGGPAHPYLAWPLLTVGLASFVMARILQARYERHTSCE